MDIKQLITEINQGYQEAGPEQLEVWLGTLSTMFAVTAEELGEVKKNRAKEEIQIKQDILNFDTKPTEKEIERTYYATSHGQYLAYNTELLKALSKLISSIRFKLDALRGNIH